MVRKRDEEGTREGARAPRAGDSRSKNSQSNSASKKGKAGVKHTNVTEASARRTEGTVAKSAVKAKVAARISADKPGLKGKALDTRVAKQTAASVARKEERGMTVTGKGKKKK